MYGPACVPDKYRLSPHCQVIAVMKEWEDNVLPEESVWARFLKYAPKDTTTPSIYDQVQAWVPSPGGTPLQYRDKRP